GLVEHLGIGGAFLSVIKVYVGLLAATILFIATNAGVIGASRITYAMAGYRQLPTLFRRLHPKFKTPWIALVVFAGFISILVLIPGKTNFLGTMYAFGAMLSFTIAPGYASDEAMDFACRLAAERRASIVAFTAIEVPLDLPLDTELAEEVQEANEQLDEARAIGDSYGVRVIGRIARTRNIGRAIVDEAIRRNSEIIVMAGPRRVRLQRGRRQIFGDAVDFVLRHAPCRVMVATPRERAA